MNKDFEKCENCECQLPYEEMEHDREGVPLCPECMEQFAMTTIWEAIEYGSIFDEDGCYIITLEDLKDILIAYNVIEEETE